MRTLVIHAGPAKTGSSTIQRFLFANAAVLAEAGFYIPKQSASGTKGNHTHLMWPSGNQAEVPPAAQVLARELGEQVLVRELGEQDFPQTVIMSYEGYGGMLARPEFRQAIAGFAGTLGYRINIVSFVRPQLALINSHYNELAKGLRPVPPFEDVLEKWASTALLNNYQRRRDAFTRGGLLDVAFLPFTQAKSRAGLAQGFLRHLGVPDAVIARCQPVAHGNPSLGPKALAAMLAIGTALGDDVKDAPPARLSSLATLLHDMLSARGWNVGRFDGLDAAAKDRLRSTYAPSNQAFARAAWNKDWQEVFGTDEADLMAQLRSVYDPATGDPQERAAFEEFCREGAALVREMLPRA